MFYTEYKTTKRWQTEAIDNYQSKKVSWDTWESPVPPPKQEAWWHENPIFIATSAWTQLSANIIATLICGISIITKLGLWFKNLGAG